MAILPDFAAMLNNAVASSPSNTQTYGSGVRNAIVFSSVLRQRLLNPGTNVIPEDFPQNAYTDIVMPINPDTIRFRQGKRISAKNTREGTVYFHFTNKRGQNNDVLVCEISGTTGNIDRRGALTTAADEAEVGQPTGTAIANADDNGAVAKLLAWHNLYLLSMEPILLPDGVENTASMTYISPLFPMNVDFFGHFNQVLDFEELATQPNERPYHFELTVTRTEPPLLSIIDSIFTALQQATLQPSSTGLITGTGPGTNNRKFNP